MAISKLIAWKSLREGSLRRLVITVLFGLLVIASMGAGPAQAQNGVVTFTFINNGRYIILMKMFSANRRWVWPSPSTHYVLDDEEPRSAKLACNVGEKICFGGSYRENDRPVYWGVGYLGNKGCQGCCLICGTEDDDVNARWRLVE
jgi:hypothetical protein